MPNRLQHECLVFATELLEAVAGEIASENVVGWFAGRMEFGPRALGCRSIIGDARSPAMQTQMNLRIKFRESFRPFAPVVLREEVSNYFDLDGDSILDLELDEEGLGTAMLPADQPLSVSLELADGPRRFVGVFQFVAGVSIETIQLDTMTLVIELDAPLADGYLCFEVEGDLDCIRGEPIDVGSHGPIVRFDHLPLAATDRVIRKFERDSPVRSLEAELEGLPTTPGMTRRLEWRSNSAGD